jgi:hypothetical protein
MAIAGLDSDCIVEVGDVRTANDYVGAGRVDAVRVQRKQRNALRCQQPCRLQQFALFRDVDPDIDVLDEQPIDVLQ